MTSDGNLAVTAARKAVYDKVASQLHTLEAQLATLAAKAESVKAGGEITALANLATAKRALDLKLADLKSNGETAFDQVKADVERRVAEFDKSVKAIAARITRA